MKGNVLLSVRQERHRIVYEDLLSYNNLTINNVSENRQMTNYVLQKKFLQFYIEQNSVIMQENLVLAICTLQFVNLW